MDNYGKKLKKMAIVRFACHMIITVLLAFLSSKKWYYYHRPFSYSPDAIFLIVLLAGLIISGIKYYYLSSLGKEMDQLRQVVDENLSNSKTS